MKYLPAVSLGLSVVLGIVAFMVLRSDQTDNVPAHTDAIREVASVSVVETVPVLVVRQEIAAGEPVPADAVKTVEWPEDLAPDGVLSSASDLAAPGGAPRIAQTTLLPGEPLLAVKVADTPPRRMLSRDIPEGYRAVSISVTNATNVSGFVLPGDRVDLMAYVEVPGKTGPDAFTSRPLIGDVLVLGVDQFMGHEVEGALPASLVTFALKPEDAQRITAAARNSRLGLALIGQDEIDAEAEDREADDSAAEEAPQPRPQQVRRARSPLPQPETTRVKVVHGADVTTVTAPVEKDEPVDLMAEINP